MSAREPVNRQFTGIAASPGVAVAVAHVVHDIPELYSADPLDEARTLSELTAFEHALRQTASELEELRDKVTQQVGGDEAAIFQAHLAILSDAALTSKVRQLISHERIAATAALRRVLDEYAELFSRINDEYLKERVADLRDVLRRLGTHITRAAEFTPTPRDEPVILVAHELLPSDVVALSEDHQVHGIATQSGGRTSHAAILARSYGIPAVAGVTGILGQLHAGDMLILDGSAGKVLVNPGKETLRAYQKLRREYVQLKRALAVESIGPALTADAQRIELLANVSCLAEAAEANRVGADGIGLFRTEFYFLTHPGLPTEDEQVDAYRDVLMACRGRPVTIRTLDLGGDKTIPYLTHAPEANPFMGWRSIRLSLAHPELFLQQIRAVLRAAHNSENLVRMLFPMITTWEELQRVHLFVHQARDQLERSGLPFGNVQLGMMLEVPAAAVLIEQLLELVDFVSIGSNDLVQYLTAADRDNPKVSHLCQALSPAVLKLLKHVIGACVDANKPVTVCGEMAGSPRAFPLLLGMKLRSFSMSPSFIPAIHNFAARITLAEAESILADIMKLKTAGEIQREMDARVQRLYPDVTPLLMA